ncbi:hypothetical protein PGB34_03285 [Xenophilus arseniciresistens]|uniref:Uncharacterized protein n=1 Tax=Xenophilus arseniciresistens TaxID=1283306 RepID=A0AAE3N6C3_9BURK|nr:hypothetical protein [Xenophilus arseniciresistens]MDA7415378.1 hypothetical protein [Xenophilus arseniciresistens]
MGTPIRHPAPANPYENRSDAPLPPSTQVDQDQSPAGDRGDGARRHREQREQVAGTPGSKPTEER